MRPILFHLPFDISLYSYGLMLTVSVIFGRLLAIRLAERAGIDGKLADCRSAVTFGGANVGRPAVYLRNDVGSIGHVLGNLPLVEGRLRAYGRVLRGLGRGIVFRRIHDLSLLAWAECFAPSLCVG